MTQIRIALEMMNTLTIRSAHDVCSLCIIANLRYSLMATFACACVSTYVVYVVKAFVYLRLIGIKLFFFLVISFRKIKQHS